MRTVIVGGTAGLGLEIARHRARRGDDVVITGRDGDRCNDVAGGLGPAVSGIPLELGEPHALAAALADVGDVDRLVLSAIDRDANSVGDYDIDAALRLATIKLIGYTEVVHCLGPRMGDRASIVIFGGRAKDKPYPGSTTVSTVNGGVIGMVMTMALELAPIRVNGLHPGIVGDSPFWAAKPESVLEAYRSKTPTGHLATMADIVNAVDFLLENGSVNAQQLYIDGGWLVT